MVFRKIITNFSKNSTNNEYAMKTWKKTRRNPPIKDT